MNEAEKIGDIVQTVITFGSFLAVVFKFTQPINELRLVIQELKDYMREIAKDNDIQNKRLDDHGKEIDNLKLKVNNLHTRMDMYHKE